MRADRLLSMMLLLQTKGRMTAHELARELEVSQRTIYRDLDALSIAGIPVYTERGPQGGISLLDDYRTTLTGLTAAETQALFSAILPDPAGDLGADNALKQALLKLTAALPAKQQNQVETVRHRIHLDSAAWFQAEEPTPFLPLVQEALWQQRRLKILYRRADGAWVRRLLDPHGLVAKASVWYVVAALSRRPMVYRVSRIQEATLTENQFERLQGFDLPAFWQQWTARIEINKTRYPALVRVHINKVGALMPAFGEGIHQIIAEAGSPNKAGCLTLSLTFTGRDDALQTLAGLGSAVAVVSPVELRQGLVELGRALVGENAGS